MGQRECPDGRYRQIQWTKQREERQLQTTEEYSQSSGSGNPAGP